MFLQARFVALAQRIAMDVEELVRRIPAQVNAAIAAQFGPSFRPAMRSFAASFGEAWLDALRAAEASDGLDEDLLFGLAEEAKGEAAEAAAVAMQRAAPFAADLQEAAELAQLGLNDSRRSAQGAFNQTASEFTPHPDVAAAAPISADQLHNTLLESMRSLRQQPGVEEMGADTAQEEGEGGEAPTPTPRPPAFMASFHGGRMGMKAAAGNSSAGQPLESTRE